MSASADNQELIKKKNWFRRLRAKYVLIIRDDETLEPKISFRLTRLNVFVVSSVSALFLIIATTYIIAFTSLKEYIPGYADQGIIEDLYRLSVRADSLERIINANKLYIENIRRILVGEPPVERHHTVRDTVRRDYKNITLKSSPVDSLFRKKTESEFQAQATVFGQHLKIPTLAPREVFNFFTPLKGIITNEFDPAKDHFGVDIVAPQNEAVKATLDGMVVFTGWTSETGHVIILQHQRNYVSVYKHNSVLLKKEGTYVRAGEPIAMVGHSGRLTTGPHLHFELWFNGSPVDPRNYMSF